MPVASLTPEMSDSFPRVAGMRAGHSHRILTKCRGFPDDLGEWRTLGCSPEGSIREDNHEHSFSIVGLGSYVRTDVAVDIAFVVEEDFQGRGIASRLLQQLADITRALAAGTRMVLNAFGDKARIDKLVAGLRFQYKVKVDDNGSRSAAITSIVVGPGGRV
jgi:GNAT superfamily N-acetyltransferase